MSLICLHIVRIIASSCTIHRGLPYRQSHSVATLSPSLTMASDHEQHKMDAEASVKRNPHPDFKKVEASRPDWNEHGFSFTKTRNPNWKFGQGATDGGASLQKKHIEIDPYEEGSEYGSDLNVWYLYPDRRIKLVRRASDI